MIELYTSEGCSSCPPADRWISTLRQDERLWQDLVPIAFHVDYWNYLGWEDRFASPAYAARQRDYRRVGGASAVYTPGMFASGREWRGWRQRSASIPTFTTSPGVLAFRLQGDSFAASFAAEESGPEHLELYVAILGFDLETSVRAGENRGELLRHDFVVLGMQRYSGVMAWSGALPNAPLAGEAGKLALVAWVGEAGKPAPLQAVGGWLPVEGFSAR